MTVCVYITLSYEHSGVLLCNVNELVKVIIVLANIIDHLLPIV